MGAGRTMGSVRPAPALLTAVLLAVACAPAPPARSAPPAPVVVAAELDEVSLEVPELI